jgi:HEAT repeat protein
MCALAGYGERSSHGVLLMPIRLPAGLRAGVLVFALLGAAASSAAQTPFDPILTDLRSSRESTRIKALRTLTQSGYPQVLSAMAPVVLDPADTVQLEAIDALLTVCLAPAPDPRRARPFKAENGSIAAAVFDALPLSVLPRAVPGEVLVNLSAATRDDDARVRTAAALALGTLGSAALGVRPADVERSLVTDIVYALRHPDPATREALLRAAARLFEPPPHASAPVAVGDAVIASLNDPDRRVRLWASDTLGWLRERRAAPALGERLVYYGKGEEAEAALHALARIAPEPAVPTFRAFLTSASAPMRVMALEGLGRAGEASAVQAITSALAAEKDPTVLLAGAFAYFRLGGEANLDQIVVALTNPALARQARAYLTELGPEAAPGLQAYLERPDPALRQAVAEVLGVSGDQRSLRALEAAARDADPAVAETVRQALLRLRALPAGVRAH